MEQWEDTNECPYCHNVEDFHSVDMAHEKVTHWVSWHCNHCGASWNEVYELRGIERIA